MGTTGNRAITAAILFFPTVVLLLSGRFVGFRPNLIDGLYAGFIVCICMSMLVNGPPPVRELLLLLLSLLNYPAARFVAVTEPQRSFIATTSLIVVAGAVATAIALAGQTEFMTGKPIVFGFGHAVTVFTNSLCFLVISLVSSSMSSGHLIRIGVGLLIPAAIFAASQVRFVFVALAVALAAATVAGRRKFGLLTMAALGVAILFGLATNFRLTELHIERDILGRSEVVDAAGVAQDPASAAQAACLGLGSYNNSIAIRRVLLSDAINKIPSSGFFGSGLASFKSPCLGLDSPHNSLLQAFIEFGWIGGLVLATLVACAVCFVWPIALHDAGARFVLCCLVFTTVASMAYGELEADALLYLFLGLSAASLNRYEIVKAGIIDRESRHAQ
jgi:hypothetical protein